MVKNYRQITYKYLKRQKNRTLLTILGIVLSVALISAIGTIIISARGALIKQSIRENGSYHATFGNLDQAAVEKLKNHVEVEEIGISSFQASGVIRPTTEKDREANNWHIPNRYLEINRYDAAAIAFLPYTLKEGRFPETSDEIVMEFWIKGYFEQEVKIGDTISLVVGDRIVEDKDDENGEPLSGYESFNETGQKHYTVVGFTKPKYIWRGSLVTEALVGFDDSVQEGGTYNAHIKLVNIKDANDKIEQIRKDIGADEDYVTSNYRLLRLSAESLNETFNKALVSLVIFVVLLIMISTIAVIYNAFNISVLERISEFGLLRSVGATPAQIRGIVLKEALILSAIGIPIGLFAGVFAMKIVMLGISLISSDIGLFQDMEITISWRVFGMTTILGFMTVILSAIGPTRRAGRVSPLEAIRNTGDLKKESLKKVKSSKLVRKVMGIEGEIAYKNLRRNKKRFMITVFSMVISIALFITFSSFSDFIVKTGVMAIEEMADFTIYGGIGDRNDEVATKLKSLEDVSRVYETRVTSGAVLAGEDKIASKLIELQPNQLRDREGDLIKIPNVSVYTIGDNNFDVLHELLIDGSIDVDKLNEEDGVLIINTTNAFDEANNGNILMEGYKFAVGDQLLYGDYGFEMENEKTQYSELNVVGILEKGILGDAYNRNGSINIITTETVWARLFEEGADGSGPNSRLEFHTEISVEMNKGANLESITRYLDELGEEIPELSYMNAAELLEENRSFTMIMNIFLYGFVGIITLISSINIINTISTNIILRTKEIAMIKAVGMSQRGIKKMVAFESLFYGLYAAVLGGTLGVGLTYILFNIVIGISEFDWSMPWESVIIACVGATVIALLSGIYPLKRINDGIIVESMKAEN